MPLGQAAITVRLSALYIGFGLTMGAIQGGLPTVLRAQGVSIGSAGWLYALYLPFGIAFLWSPLIDRWRTPVLTPRIGWIVPMQCLAALTVGAVAFLENVPVPLLFALGLLVACAMATMDIALDALAVELIAPDWRPNAAAAKLAALSLGAMIGGGAFVALFQSLGWRSVLLSCALVLLILPVAVLPLSAAERALPRRKADPGGASLLAILRDPLQRKRLWLLTAACCVIFPLSGLNRLMLLDLGVTPETIGWMVGTLTPLCMLVVAGTSASLMKHLGRSVTMVAFAALGLAALAAMGFGYALRSPWLAIGGAISIAAAISGIYVVITAGILRWAQGSQPATDYAVFYGVGRFASTVVTIAAAQFIGSLGWLTFYAVGGGALLVVVGLLLAPISKDA
ncbi:MFS transporter [Hyphomicrobiales bacterium]|nr:MFS transporter [Hyphomicrobiales bacterium]CAH1701048.1 conserved membrane hypothetical protein [Hyphomicrobiales bacterium]CAI0344107.1 MFS transporter [Hyphomicrobiales bacterium]